MLMSPAVSSLLSHEINWKFLMVIYNAIHHRYFAFFCDLQLFVSRLDVFLFRIVSHSGSGSVQLNMRALFSEELLWSLI